jgi:hypothetical protein
MLSHLPIAKWDMCTAMANITTWEDSRENCSLPPYDINNAGQILGYARNAEDTSSFDRKSFIYQNGIIPELELPGVGGGTKDQRFWPDYRL